MRSKRFSLSRGENARFSPSVRVLFWLFSIAFFVSTLRAQTNSSAADLPTTPFRGESSCSSSSCHGGAGEKRNQCIRWSKFDVHTRSYATLTLARSARIADVLHLGDPVQSERCTVCHAPFQTIATSASLRQALDPAAGVSCENCHGASEKWFYSHTRDDFTHQDRVNAGMRDLENLYVRANTCVACHQNVDADILQAGHPELIFELDGQAVNEPKHWREKGDWSGPQTWLIGQAVALREMSWQLSREKSPTENATNRWLALAWLMQIVTPESAFPKSEQDWSDKIARSAVTKPWPPDATRKCLDSLANTASSFRDTSISRNEHARRAERLVLALDRLVNGLNDDVLAKRLDSPLAKLFKDSQSLPDFKPETFAADLEAFQKALSSH